MFAQDGSMLHCSSKSVLIDILEDYLPSDHLMNELFEIVLEEIITDEIEEIIRILLLDNPNEEEYSNSKSQQADSTNPESIQLSEEEILYSSFQQVSQWRLKA